MSAVLNVRAVRSSVEQQPCSVVQYWATLDISTRQRDSHACTRASYL